MRSARYVGVSILGLAAANLAAPAHAQLDEIVITAQKRSESLQDVPVAVSAFSGESLTNFGVSGTQTLQNVTPGLTFTRTGPSAQPYIRGIGTRLSGTGLEPSVAVYIDDRYEPLSTAMMFELADVERVEILKGPQGALYGRNATAGAIRVISKGVTDDTEGQVIASLGNYDMYSLSGTVNLPITDNFGTRLTGIIKKRDAFAHNLVPGARDVDDLDALALRGKFRLQASDTVTANLELGYWKRSDAAGLDYVDLSPDGYSTGLARSGITGKKRNEVATALDSLQDAEQFSGQFRVDAELGGVDFASITSYAEYDGVTFIDADGTSARIFDSPNSNTLSNNFSQEVQLLSQGKQKVDWIIGAYYFNGYTKTDNKIDLGGPLLMSAGAQTAKTDAFAIFGQATMHMGDALSVTAGGRWNYEKKQVHVVASPDAPGGTLALVPFSDSKGWSSFTPKLTVQYDFQDVMAYLTLARGFKSGGYNYPAKNAAGVGVALDPEVLDMVELGVKGDFFDGNLRANAAAYFYNYKDLQVTRASTAGGGSVTSVTENAADAQIYGLDVDLTWQVVNHFTLTGGFNISHSEYRNFETTAKMFNAVVTGTSVPGMRDVFFDASGHGLLRSPDWSGFVAAEYDMPLGEGRLPITISYSYKDDYLFDFVAGPTTERLRQKGYGLLNGRISYVSPGDSWKLSAWVENLTDKQYFDDIVGGGAGIRGSYGAPRTYGVDVSYRF